MKRNVIRLLAAIGIVLSLSSCSKKGELELYDLGKAKFKEPFVGLLKGRPGILVKSLNYPPYSWAAPDTAFVEKTFKITFNEDCVRSGSEATIQIKDLHYAPSEGIRVFHNGKYVSNGEFKVVADSLEKTVTLRYMLSPSLGKATIDGYVLVRGEELDSVNGRMLQQDNNVVGNWTCEQKIGWPIILWLLWFLTALIILCIALAVIAGIVYLCYWIGQGIGKLNAGDLFPWPFLKYYDPNDAKISIRNKDLAGKTHEKTGVPFVKKLVLTDSGPRWWVGPQFESKFNAKLPRELYRATDVEQNKECNKQLSEGCKSDPELRKQFSETQLEQIESGRTPEGYTWNHDLKKGVMQLVDHNTHLKTGHTGGKKIWGGGGECR